MMTLSAAEQKDVNLVPVLELDRQVMSGDRVPVCINDGRIVETKDEA